MTLSPMVLRIGALWCSLLLASGAPVAAGQLRAEQLAAQREARARVARPAPATGLEGFLLRAADGRWPTRLLNPRSGPFLLVGLSGEGAGLGLGPAWRVSPVDRRYTGTASFVASGRANWSGQVELAVPDLLPKAGTDRVGLSLTAGRHERSRDALSQRGAAADIILRLRPALHAGLTAGVMSSMTTDQGQAGLMVPITHAHVGASLTIDHRNTVPPTRTGHHLDPVPLDGASAGRLLRVDWSRFSDTRTGTFSFRRTTIDVQQYVPLLHGHRVLAFRALAILTSAGEGAQVPFHFMPSLGGTRVGRAYTTFGFRDRKLVAAQAEYRYVLNPFMHGAVFVDAAQVAPRLDELAWRRVRWSAGVGLRLGVRGGAALRFDVAFGRDAARFVTGLGHAF